MKRECINCGNVRRIEYHGECGSCRNKWRKENDPTFFKEPTDKCLTCGKLDNLVFGKYCSSCRNKWLYRNDPVVYLNKKYSIFKQRCCNKNNPSYTYYGGKIVCSREEFLEFSFKDNIFTNLYNNWKDGDYDFTISPSIDRIDNTKGYLIDNLQWLTHSKNSGKDKSIPILAFHFNTGEFVDEYESYAEAGRQLGVEYTNIYHVVKGNRNQTGGYTFKKKELGEVKK